MFFSFHSVYKHTCTCIIRYVLFVLTDRIVNFPANLTESEVRQAISDAFRVWSDVSLLSFHQVRSGHADILIQFLTGFHDDKYPFDGPGN